VLAALSRQFLNKVFLGNIQPVSIYYLATSQMTRGADWVRQSIAHIIPKPPQVTAGDFVVYKK
jgi:hypothetical protein